MDTSLQTFFILGAAAFCTGIYASRRRTPMWLWPGYTISPDRISDIRRFNRIVGTFWMAYALPYLVAAAVSTRDSILGAKIATWNFTAGTLGLCVALLVVWLVYRVNRH